MKSRNHFLPLALITLVVGALTAASMIFINWYPERAAAQADRVDNLVLFMHIVSGVIFTGVTSVLLYAVWRFRAKPDDESEGPPLHGHTRLEIIWTILPFVLLGVTSGWAIWATFENEAIAADQNAVSVTARQFAWEFTYPEAGIQTGDLRVPVGKQVRLDMRATDVIHSFYVPEFRVKQDVVPGITTHMVFDPTKVGTYPIVCAELCGAGHGIMRSRVIIMEQADYDAWIEQAKREAAKGKAPAGHAGLSTSSATTGN